ncbi:hypothetical protein [Bythopirellula goksoeyrii]|uniref:Uncharacterized protein n=1 Tax=Bythopirellula goksoeyrii TaxID=1400387 RepID=A0A5B9Q8U3_9BACT|nr:hypothetical protein [Bythopirellula goksoeyrii]QEG35338.1 hypothetical protein Pr1d_26360 [Bythopirellula goksoeyrii]
MTISARHAMPTNINISGPLKRLASGLLSRQAVWAYWIFNLALLVGLIIWVGLDGRFSQAARLLALVDPKGASNLDITQLPHTHYLSSRIQLLHLTIIAGFVSAGCIVIALFFGAHSNRRLRSWFAVMVALAAWLTFYETWPDLAWRAQALRVAPSLPAMEKVAQSLLKNWPNQDGVLPDVGPFNAYPIGKPRTLMMLKRSNPLHVSSIERGTENDLYFQLTGNNEGATLARLPQETEPLAYYSGLEGRYEPFRFQALGQNWFLVEFLYAPIVDGLNQRSLR